MQQGAFQRMDSPVKLGRSCQSIRPGSAIWSRLADPPVKTHWAEPFHTVPRGSRSCNCSCVAHASPLASQYAGANATKATIAPAQPPVTAQRHGARVLVAVAGRWGAGQCMLVTTLLPYCGGNCSTMLPDQVGAAWALSALLRVMRNSAGMACALPRTWASQRCTAAAGAWVRVTVMRSA